MRRKPLFPPPRRASGQRAHNKGRRCRSLLTINGRITISRRHWHLPGQDQFAGQTLTPIDSLLGIADASLPGAGAGAGVTKGVRELRCRLNLASTSFDAAAEHLQRAAQLSSSAELLRQVVEAQAQHVVQVQQSRMLPAAWQAEDCRTPAGTTRVYVGCDGVMVPVITHAEKRQRRAAVVAKRRQRAAEAAPLPPLPRLKPGADQPYKEFKLVLHYDQGHQHTHASITRHDHRVAQALLRRDAAKIGLHRADEKIANVDGAVWIRGRLQDARLKLDAIGLDFCHLGQHVHQARREVLGEATPQGQAWAGALLHRVKHEGYDAFWEQLSDTRRNTRSPGKRKALDRLMHYAAERRDMIQYPQFLARGWDIGSGPTEAACKTLPARLKRSGMRWNPGNAEAIANLTALHQNQQWRTYWTTAI